MELVSKAGMRIFVQYILPILPQVSALFFACAALYCYRNRSVRFVYKTRVLLAGIGGWLVVWGFLITFTQYWVWSQSVFTRFLLPPHQSVGYFIVYSGRFWLPLLSIGLCAALWLVFSYSVNKYKLLFKEAEPEWLAAGMLICGWPYGVAFLFFAFILTFVRGLFDVVRKRSNRPLDLVYSGLVVLWVVVVYSVFEKLL